MMLTINIFIFMHENVKCLNLSVVVQCCLEATNFKKIMNMFIDIVIVSNFKQEKHHKYFFLIYIILRTVEG